MLMSSAIGGQLSHQTTSTTGIASRVANYLRCKHPVKTADNVAADTGLKADAVKKVLARGSLPNGEGMLALIRAYGPEFLISIMTDDMPAWLTTGGQADAISSREARIAQLKADRTALRS